MSYLNELFSKIFQKKISILGALRPSQINYLIFMPIITGFPDVEKVFTIKTIIHKCSEPAQVYEHLELGMKLKERFQVGSIYHIVSSKHDKYINSVIYQIGRIGQSEWVVTERYAFSDLGICHEKVKDLPIREKWEENEYYKGAYTYRVSYFTDPELVIPSLPSNVKFNIRELEKNGKIEGIGDEDTFIRMSYYVYRIAENKWQVVEEKYRKLADD